ncbi:alpha/beta fold hydrolase [Shewanella mesophila]|uniref:alpha/beta fold hydrolase n=1 Tax=Shewanella mesophila TaxID=2864208 RepID=UPI001C6597C3|nr:alpha/beta fold hydrolase [Shewanella mesophila]QYJ86099.1 alpha/beta fold hydrolase [Shewanella mesophila]
MFTAINDQNIAIKPLLFSSEESCNTEQVDRFWLGVTEGMLTTQDNVSLAYCFIKHPQSSKAIVISSGRIEAYLKYKELIFDLYHLGYSIYALDHRGQGLSSRLSSNPHQGHINSFDDYIDDFDLFINDVVKPAKHKSLFLVGHSMGGTIGTLYIKKSPSTFKAAVFSAPMYGIVLPLNKHFIRWLAKQLDNGSASHPNYVIGGKDYTPEAFKHNDLTHSESRYNNYRQIYQALPQLQLGSPTNRWLIEAIDASERAVIAAKESQTPILILQAEEDSIVDNDCQDRAASEHCVITEIASARHEIFMEKDLPRNHALSLLSEFLNLHS